MGDHTNRQSWKPALGAYSSRARRKAGGIYPEHELQDLIMYEQARADRTGERLTLVLCDLRRLKNRRSATHRVIREFARSVRRTDHLGWFSKSELGVLLPLTGRQGAEHFVRNLDLNGSGEEVTFSIHCYPDSWLENGSFDAGSGSGSNGQDPGVFTRQIPVWKRTLDIVGASIGLLVLMPLFILVGLYIKIVSPGPVLFRQKRIGLAGREFTFLKFRSMHHRNNETIHSHHAVDFINFDRPMTKLDGSDPRIIPGGRILRKLAIDELPQVFNILRGEMSLVGPRPCIPYEAEEYQQWHAHRFSILPGLTGLWQVSGKNKLTFQQMIRLDITYENKMSLWFDLWIILRTIPTVIGLGLEGVGHRIERRKARLDGHCESDRSDDTSIEAAK